MANALNRQIVMDFVKRHEALDEYVAQIKADIKVVKEQAEAAGLAKHVLRQILKERKDEREGKGQVRETQRAEFEHVADMIGHRTGTPLHRRMQAAMDAHDGSAIEAMKAAVPTGTELVLKVDGEAWRVWRDLDGVAHAEPVLNERKAKGDAPAGKPQPAPEPDKRGLPDEAEADLTAVSEDEAFAQGKAAGAAGEPVTANPFPALSRHRRAWDRGWQKGAGNDGMGPDTGGGS